MGHRLCDVSSTDEHRRSEGDHHRVYVSVGKDDLEHGPVLLGSGRGDQVDRVAYRGTLRDDVEQPPLGLGCQLGNLEAVALTRVGSENPAASGIADDRDAPAGGKGLVHQEVGDIEQLLQRLDPDDASLAKERIGGLVGN